MSSSSSSSSLSQREKEKVTLPLEIWSHIFSFVEKEKTAFELRRVSREWSQITNAVFWKQKNMKIQFGKEHAYFLESRFVVKNNAKILKRILDNITISNFVLLLSNHVIEVLLETFIHDKKSSLHHHRHEIGATRMSVDTIDNIDMVQKEDETRAWINPQTRFDINDLEPCFDWKLIPKVIRDQTFQLTTSTVLYQERLELITVLFPNISSIVFCRGGLENEEKMMIEDWLLYHHNNTRTNIPSSQMINKKGLVQVSFKKLYRINPQYERNDNNLAKPFLPPRMTTYSSFVKTLPFAVRGDLLSCIQIEHCQDLVTIDNLVNLKSATISFCDMFQTVGRNLPTLKDLQISDCLMFDGNIPCPFLETLSLSCVKAKQIVCFVIPHQKPSSSQSFSSSSLCTLPTNVRLKNITLNRFYERSPVRPLPQFLFLLHLMPDQEMNFVIAQAQQLQQQQQVSEQIIIDKLVLKQCEMEELDPKKLNFKAKMLYLDGCKGCFRSIVSVAQTFVWIERHSHIYNYRISMAWFATTVEHIILSICERTYQSLLWHISDRANEKCCAIRKVKEENEITWRRSTKHTYEPLPSGMLIDFLNVPYFRVYVKEQW